MKPLRINNKPPPGDAINGKLLLKAKKSLIAFSNNTNSDNTIKIQNGGLWCAICGLVQDFEMYTAPRREHDFQKSEHET